MKRSFASLALAAFLAACASAPPTGVLPTGVLPTGVLPTGVIAGDRVLSPFYAWSGALPAKPGVMLRSEAMAPQPEFTAAGTQQRILYTSTDARWNSGVLPV